MFPKKSYLHIGRCLLWFSSDLHKIRNLPLWYHHAHMSPMLQFSASVQMERDFQGTSFGISDNLVQNIRT